MGSNFGDYLYAQMFQDFISLKVGFDNTYFYKNRLTLSSFFRSKLKNSKRCRISDADCLVYMPGGYFCGDDTKIRHYIYRFIRYYWVGLCCIIMNKPIIIVGVEVGPMKSCFLKKVEKLIFEKSKVLTVRNQESAVYVNAICGRHTNVIVTADPVFAIDTARFGCGKLPISVAKCNRKKMFLHVAPHLSSNQLILDKIVPVVNHFLSSHSEYQVFVGTDQYSDEQIQTVNSVVNVLPEENSPTGLFYEDAFDLWKVLSSMDLIVTYKLHVGVVGCYLGKSVVSFSGHTEKIKRIYHQLGEEDRTIPINDLNVENGTLLMEKKHNLVVKVPDEIVEAANRNMCILSECIDSLLESYS